MTIYEATKSMPMHRARLGALSLRLAIRVLKLDRKPYLATVGSSAD